MAKSIISKMIKLYGHTIVLELDVTPLSSFLTYEINCILFNNKIIEYLKKRIALQLKSNQKKGSFKFSKFLELNDQTVVNKRVRLICQWSIPIDYMQLFRIYRWWYNCNIPQDGISDFFSKTFEERVANYYMEEFCITHSYNIISMVASIGKEEKHGIAFFHGVMKEVEEYEKKSRNQM
ncbi:hypothetical protein M2451_004063 [Dysgonomonas sp. PFB1-18]|uniref:hypothetical protein n=1 Tax=unclassified Dysgonomonas TaxID=2630389 RepID=UPI002476A0F8|nr:MULTISPECIES: hypothetical protein [unclassified Dysgonomonas]MDH6310898.1 hypothetical protein [Dysgonomonas sp. PF1-14]MDH6341033.1 hypothetical protein [Dysgonomonas sp. PF1-16]MDH6382716.1 hypothetical protein [Dysgonomonas sp. PFB1-18]MDH6400021.1 hypothetical protein [Dysgonomonas sp. PF1-23]